MASFDVYTQSFAAYQITETPDKWPDKRLRINLCMYIIRKAYF